MKKTLFVALQASLFAVLMIATNSCSSYISSDDLSQPLGSILVVSEGNWGSSNSTVSAYNPLTKTATGDLFSKANGGAAMGDSPTGVSLYNDRFYLTLSASGKVYIMDPTTCKLLDKITGLDSPRHISFISPNKGYISNLNQPRITIFNPSTSDTTGSIAVSSPVENFVQNNSYIYANCWSYGNKIIKIDPLTNKVVDSIEVGVQPNCLFVDANQNLWTLCDGDWDGHPDYRAPEIVRIVTLDQKMVVADRYVMPQGLTYSYRLAMQNGGSELYYIIANKLYKMSINDKSLPASPIATIENAMFYALSVNPYNGEVYVSDGVDFVQPGTIYRFDNNGTQIDKFQAGISPSGFLF